MNMMISYQELVRTFPNTGLESGRTVGATARLGTIDLSADANLYWHGLRYFRWHGGVCLNTGYLSHYVFVDYAKQ